jgi:hypothetical protein
MALGSIDMASQETFRRFYLRQVALNEGCGCSDLLVNNHNAETNQSPGDGILMPMLGVLLWPVAKLYRAFAGKKTTA